MNSKLVLWGSNAQDEKILIAMELLVQENKVKILTFPDKIVTDDYYDSMRNDWRVGKEVELEEGYTEEVRDLTASETLLPDHIKVSRTDLIERKQLEWHVMVLSSKMYDQFKSELESIKEKVDGLDAFDNAQWEGLKTFWSKVQNQIKDGILTRNYANDLRKGTDEVFDKLKGLRKKLDEEYRSKAKVNFDWFSKQLDEIEGRITEGLKLSGVFDDLKDLQRKFHNTKFTREFRDKIWSRIDGSFKAVKEKKYGKNASNESSALGRLNNRYEGLLKAIKRSEYSRDRDLKDLEFEKRRIQNTDGQLEAQIREAKIKMINQRLKFKEEKLKEMYATKDQLDSKMTKLKEKEESDKIRKEKEAAAKAKIKEEQKQTSSNLDDQTKEKLAAAAEQINESKKKGKKKKKDFIEKVIDTVNEVSEIVEEKVDDAIISAKAAAVVISEEVSEKVAPLTEKGKEIVDDLSAKAEEKVEEVKESFASSKENSEKGAEDTPKEEKGLFDKVMDVAENIKENIEEKLEDVAEKMEPYTEKGKEIVDDLTNKASEKVEEVKESFASSKDDAEENVENAAEEKKGIFEQVMDAAENIKESIEEKLEDVAEKMEPFTEKGKEIVDDLTNKASDVVEEVKDTASDVVDDVADASDDVLELDDLPPKDA